VACARSPSAAAHILDVAAGGNTLAEEHDVVAARCHTPCEVADGHPYLEEGVHSPAEAVLHAGADGRSLAVDHHVHSQAVGHSLVLVDHNLAEEDVRTQVAEA